MADEITPAVPSQERRPNPEAAPPASSSSDTTALYRRRSVPPGGDLAAECAPGRAVTASSHSDVDIVMRASGPDGTPVAAEADEVPSRLPSVSLEIIDPGVLPPPLALRHPRAYTASSIIAVVLLIAAGWLLRSLF